MANTPNGFPYPLGTDRVMDGDDAIHALASSVDARFDVLRGKITRGVVGVVPNNVWTFVAGYTWDYQPAGTKLVLVNNGVQIPTTGDYWVSGSANFAIGAAATRRGVGVAVNAVAVPPPGLQGVVHASQATQGLVVPLPGVLLALAAGDTVGLTVFQDSGANINLASSYLSVARVP